MSTSSDEPADASKADPPETPTLPPPTTSPAVSSPVLASPPVAAPPLSSPTDASVTERPGGPPPRAVAPIGARPGDLTSRWRFILAAAWIITFFAYAAVWQASVEIGIGTWWTGPRAQPTHTLVRVLPSLLAISMAMCAIYNVPRLLRLSAGGVGLATILAVPDVSRSVGLGVTELIIAGLLGLVTAAAASGRYRLAPDPSAVGSEIGEAPSHREGDTAHETSSGSERDAAVASTAPHDQPGS